MAINIEIPMTIREVSNKTGVEFRKLKRFLLNANKAYHGQLMYKVSDSGRARWMIKLSTIKRFFPDLVSKAVTRDEFDRLGNKLGQVFQNIKTLSDKQVELALKLEYLNQQLTILTQVKTSNNTIK